MLYNKIEERVRVVFGITFGCVFPQVKKKKKKLIMSTLSPLQGYIIESM